MGSAISLHSPSESDICFGDGVAKSSSSSVGSSSSLCSTYASSSSSSSVGSSSCVGSASNSSSSPSDSGSCESSIESIHIAWGLGPGQVL